MPVAAITKLIRRRVIHWGRLMGAAVLGCIPVAVIFLFLGRRYLAGLKPGSTVELALDALLVAGVLLSAFKAGDLLLRRSRQQDLPDALRRLARRLESYRPLEYLRYLASERGQRRLLLLGIVQFPLAVAVDITIDVLSEGYTGPSMTMRSFGALVCAVAIALSLLSLAVVNRLGGLALVRWLVQDTRPLAFLRRFALVFAGGVAVLGIYQGALWGVAHLLGAGDPVDILFLPLDGAGAREWLMAIGLVVASPPFVYFWILTQVGGAALSTLALVRLGGRLLSAIGAMAERLLQYDHGAWAVLVLAATVALGALKLMLSRAL